MAQDTLSSIEILWESSALPGGEDLLHHLFEARAEEEPGREALVWGEVRLTYGELGRRADCLARRLAALGIGPEVPVGICSRRSTDMVVGMLAVLKAGGAYLPLDPKYPRERLRFMLEDAGAPVVLTDSEAALALPETRAGLVFLDRVDPVPPLLTGLGPARPHLRGGEGAPTTPDNLAYLIYTSGSTGRPKGVAIPHKAAVHLMRWARDLFPPEDLAGVLAATSICFDLSVFEIFVPLSWGGRVILADNALALPALPAAAEVTLVNTVPSAANELVRSGGFPPSVRTINLAGEALQRALVDQLYRKTSALAVFNLYGPSEDTTYSTWARVSRDSGEAPTIGVPLPGETGHVLAADLLPVPDGQEGELYLGGPALARGYLARPDLTAERFLPDPFAPEPGARMYKTGDLVRSRPDGELDFLGRIDHQVKIRGFRIELGEIEAALLAVPEVKECVVVALSEESGPRLVAYVAPGDLSIPGLRRSLAARLPVHMVPSAFVLLPALPLTPNGKVDRKALPAPGRVRPDVGPFVAPRDEVEERLAGLWAEALGLDQVGIGDDFFELGGHSLVAGRLLSRIRQELGAVSSVRELFSEPTVAGFARHLRAGLESGDPAPLAGAARGLAAPPLAYGQLRLLFTHRMTDPITYNVPLTGTLCGDLDTTALRRAFTELVRRHGALRTVFAAREEGEEVQVVLPAAEVPLPVSDLSRLPAHIRESTARRIAWEESRTPFDLESGPVLRAALLRLSEREHRLLLTVHHIAWDDGTLAVVLRELPALYRSFAEGSAASLAPLPATYADYAVWQRERLQGPLLEGMLDRWVKLLSPLPEPLELPADRPRPSVLNSAGGERLFEIPDPLAQRLRALARKHGATSFMASLAIYEALLARLTGQDDVVVTAPVSTRTRIELEGVAGFFVNNLFLRARLGDDPTVGELVDRVRETTLTAFEFQELPLDLAVRRLNPLMPGGASNLLRTLFSFFPEIPEVELAPGLRLLLREAGNGTAKVDLSLFLEDRSGDRGIGGRLEFATELFDAASVQRLAGFFLTLLEGALADPGRRLSDLPLLSEAQRAQVFLEWNDTASGFPRDLCVHRLVEAQAALRPDAVALEKDGTEVTYRELDHRANLLAWKLRDLSVGPETVVAVGLERSIELIVAVVAVLKAGGAYLPLDPDHPRERREFKLDDTGARILITRRGQSDYEKPGLAVVLVEEMPEEGPGADVAPESGVTAGNLAYVLYTSGSTGRPKGVAVTHRSILRLLIDTNYIDLGPDDRMAHVSNTSFDAATLEIWGALLHGGRLVVIERGLSLMPEEMEEVIRGRGITAMFLTTSVFHQVVAERPTALSSLRDCLFGGEAGDPQRVRELLAAGPPERLVNGYGPTECTTFAACHCVRSPDDLAAGTAPVPIGRPIGSTRTLVRDRHGAPVPPGVVGELFLGGDGLARGYFARPGLTAERFVPDPLSSEPGARLYRTGDLVRQRPDGVLEYLGRTDNQVKIHGLRIELEEIEIALRAHPAVREAVVDVRTVHGDRRLVSYVVPQPGAPEDLHAVLRLHLGMSLPRYMVPQSLVRLESLPLTPVGKVDRRALPQPGEAERAGVYVAPRNPVEEALAAIWSEVLGVDRIGVHDNFFALGGHSLLIMRVLSRVREALGADLVPRDLFDAPTIEALEGRIALRQGAKLPPIVPARREGEPPLSYGQRRLWFLERMGTWPGAYGVPLAWRIEGALDVRALHVALAEVVRRHEVLRTTFPEREGEPVQSIAAPGPSPIPMPRVDLSSLPPETREREAQRLAREEAAAPFDLEAGPLLRVRLLRLAAGDHLWLVDFHHAVTDGWSLGVFAREISLLYRAFAAGRPSPLPELAVQYADYAAWQREWLESGVLEEQLAWWTRRLEGLEVLELPTDRPRPPVQTYRGSSRARRLPAELSEALRSLERSHRVTPFMALLALTAALLERYTGRRDFAVGTPSANRNRPELEPLIGFFVNMLVLRLRFEDAVSFADLLARVRESTLAAYAHPDLPFERLVEEMRPERQLSHSPLFQVLFTYRSGGVGNLDVPGLAVSEHLVENGTAKFDLSLGITDKPGELDLSIDYNTDLFETATIDRMALGFERLLAQVVARPFDDLDAFEILDEAERRQLLVEGAQGGADTAPLAALFEAQVARTPDAVALEAGGEVLSYAELDRRANRLARRLRALGVGPEVPVAVCAGRSARLVAALLGVLKAGGFYVPLDPAYPAERLAFTLQDSAAAVLLTEERWLDRLPEHGAQTVLLDWEDVGAGLVPAREVGLQNLAYVIYTSGSTGRPKGVAITHGSAAALVRWAQRAFDPACLESVLASTSVCFDLSVFELFVPLASGGRVVLVENALALTPAARVTLVNTVPSAMAELARMGSVPPSVQVVNLAGEPLRGSLVEAVHRSSAVREVRNLYGPSEDTTYSTWTVAPRGEEPSIGRPVDGTRACIADSRLRLVPPGVPGELLLGGDGLARGYLARPDLTAERFVPDPFSGRPGERLYRTGDLVRLRPGGELEFLGRLDHQVKLRGFRIELGEIESALREQPGVQDALVLMRDHRLVAYVLGEAPDPRVGLVRKLPEYMIPSAFVRLDAFPLTPTGKVDRRALPAPGEIGTAAEHVAPRSAVEEALAAIWCEVLGRELVGVRDDFFALGGHSLLATRVISRVRRDFGTDLPLRTIFEAPTVADLAQALARTHRTVEEFPRRESPAARFPVSFSQLRLWLLDRLEPGTCAYNIPLPLRLEGPLDRPALERSLAEIVRRHEGLRTVFGYDGGEPVQVVLPGGEIEIPLVDLSALPQPERDREARRLARRDQDRGFDLSRWPLLRATLVLLEPGRHDFLFVVHHAVSDGWSMGVLFRELGALYEAFAAGRPGPLPELPIQYPDFAVWQRRRLQGPYLESLLAYWRGQLAEAEHVLELPADRRRPPVITFRGAHETLRLPGSLVDGLRRREGRGRTTFMVLLGALEALLSRWSGQDDFCIGTYIANRNRAEIENLIGFFVNTLALRADLGALGERPTFDRLLDQVARTTLGAYMHQDLPLERLLEELQPRRDPSRTPIFQVMLNLQNMPTPPMRFGELTMSHLPLDLRRSNFDLTFWFQPDESGMELDVEYSTDLFDRSTVQRLAGQYLRLLEAALAEPGSEIGLLPLLGEGERRQVLVDWNRTAFQTGAEVPVHARFEEQVRRVPDKPAVEMAGAVLTYAELDRRSTALALALRQRGVGPETVVGVALRRSPEMIVALLGVLKSGGAYLPLDPGYPRERLAYMLREAEVPLVLTDARSSAHLPLRGVGILDVEEAAAGAADPPDGPASGPDNLAYVIFTSGSTGRPKGVMVTHRSLANHTASAIAGYEIRESDRILQFASLSFDTSAEEIYPCLAAGAELVLRDESMLTSAGQLLAAVDRLRISVLNFPTAFWHEIAAGLEREAAGLPPSVRLVIVGGETMLKDRMESWFRAVSRRAARVRLMNSYGPTEGTVVATRSLVEPGRLAPAGDPLLGRPIHNVRMYVLGRHLEPAPVGLPGEAYIGGMGVARGYLGRPDLTAERFVPDPFGEEPGARLYRTGDRLRWLPSGELDFLGRVDQQVKIRGFRVEVGEVEEALRHLSGVRDAVVEARPDGSGSHRLVAWVVPEGEALPPDLRGLLKERLPDYMVPSVFVPLPEVPKTPSNKIDRKALPEPEPPRPDSGYTEPQSELERVISGIWQEVLGVGRVGAHDNFFDLGGHSLLVVQAHGRLREALGRDLDILLLFQRPSVSALARELSRKPAERPAFTQAQQLARQQRQINTGRKQFMEQMMKQRKGRP